MPAKLSYSAISKRFDFAVPLEDIFTQSDIHPRLAFIFQQAYELYLESHLGIKDILNEQWCLMERLQLKQRIIYDSQPGINVQYTSAGTYLWMIRHFLGLLPVPLIPAITSTHKFPWKELSIKCRNFLQPELRTGEEYNSLHCSVARTLSYLPREHILLLNTLIVFIREISKRKSCKTTILCLARYYCDAIFIRPFRPGHQTKNETMLPLLMFIITRWYHILKFLKNDNIPSFSYENSCIGFDTEKKYVLNSSTQTSRFSTEITTFSNEPRNFVKYLKDAQSQTDTRENNLITSITDCSLADLDHNKLLKIDKNTVFPDDSSLDVSNGKEEDVSLNSFNAHLKMRKMSFVSSLININEEEEYIHCEKCEKYNTLSSTVNNRNNDWSDVVEEISRTVKKVDGYNYEDESGRLELADEYTSATSALTDTFETGSFETDCKSFRDCTFKSAKNDSKQTDDLSFKSIKNESKETHTKKKQRQNNSLYRSFYSSDEELYNMNGKKNHDSINWEQYQDEHSSPNFSLKKLKVKFNFLRRLSPKLKRSSEAFRNISARNIKYKKIKI